MKKRCERGFHIIYHVVENPSHCAAPKINKHLHIYPSYKNKGLMQSVMLHCTKV